MSFIAEALRDKPAALYLMDDSSPYTDYSGHSRVGTLSGSNPARGNGVVKGSTNAYSFTNVSSALLESPVFKQGFESRSFTLEAWVRINRTTLPLEQQILGNVGQMDGLLVNGSIVSFSMKYDSGVPEARISVDMQWQHMMHIVGVHTSSKNSLYINGNLVGEITLTEEQQSGRYVATDPTNMSAGVVSGTTQSANINGIGIYTTALNQSSILRHYEEGVRVKSAPEVVQANGGTLLDLGLSNAELFLSHSWSTVEDLSLATLRNVVISGDRLVPQQADGISLSGDWTNTISLDSSGDTSIYGVVLDWDGVGCTVQVSLDGTTWSTATRGQKVDIIAPGFNPSGQVMLIKVSFTGGVTDDTSYLRAIEVFGIRSNVLTNISGEVMSLVNATPGKDYRYIDRHDNQGLRVESGGTLTITPDVDTPVRTIELWAKRIDSPNPTVSMTGTVYVNGVTGTTTWPIGRWMLMHIVSDTDVTTDIVITGPIQISHVALYDRPLSATEVAQIEREYIGADTTQIGDNSVINMTESAQAVDIYAHDWTILASG